VSEFAFREERIGQAEKYIPLSARSDCFLQFYFKDQYRVLNVSSGAIHLAPRCVLVGPHTQRREDLLCTGYLRMFTIRFSAIGFRTLFGIPARLIADYADPADAVLGASLREFEDRLASSTLEQMPIVAEAFLLRQREGNHHLHGSEVAGNLVRSLQTSHGDLPIRHLGELYGLSVRQIERTFLEHVGLTPKVFGRLARLKRALALGEIATAPDWADIAARSGYFDQAHMIREFRTFNGATPVQFAAIKRRGSLCEALSH
jgi:AraC-like DNA-binding protein